MTATYVLTRHLDLVRSFGRIQTGGHLKAPRCSIKLLQLAKEYSFCWIRDPFYCSRSIAIRYDTVHRPISILLAD